MLKKLLQEIVVLVVGKQAEPIADLLYSKKHVNEFNLAKKLDITINQTRNILYKISDHGFVSSIRKKDKRKGWYTYFWRIEIIKALEFYKSILYKRIDQIRNQIKSRETKQFYVCLLCHVEFNEENALLRDFTCSECGNVFVLKDNSPVLKELRKQLSRLNSDLASVEEEVTIENRKLEKIREKEEKRKQKEKDKIKAAKKKIAAAKRAETKKAKEKLKTKSVKKIIKKKPVKKKVIKKKSKKIPRKNLVKRKPVKRKFTKKIPKKTKRK